MTDEIVAAYLDGATYAEIRERFGVGTYQIRSRLRVAGVAPMPYRKPRGGRTPPSPAMVAKARALRDQGLTWREIGAEVHRSRWSVARWFAARGGARDGMVHRLGRPGDGEESAGRSG